MNRLALRQVLRASPVYRPQPVRIPSTTVTLIQSRLATSVTQTSFWKSLIPKPLRRSEPEPNFGPKKSLKKPKSNEWNPATFFIIIFLLIGSMSIQMISLKKDFATFMRQADVRIGLLREVIEKIQKGEEVDVEKVLGTGDPERELAWEDGKRTSGELGVAKTAC